MTESNADPVFRHLLVPLDGSSLAESVLPVVARLAVRFGGRVTLLHVLEGDAPAHIHGQPHLREQRPAVAYLAGVAEWLEERGVAAEPCVEHGDGDVARRISGEAARVGAGLVALCTHGWRGVRGLLFGRVAQQVLAVGDHPVLLVPPGPRGREDEYHLRRILLPLSAMGEGEAALDAAETLARAFGAELLLESVVPTAGTVAGARGASSRLLPVTAAALLEEEVRDAADYLERVVLAARRNGVDARAIVERGDAVRVLSDAAARHHADLLAIATHGRSGVSALWAGSVASRILERTPCPMLLVRMPAAGGVTSDAAGTLSG